MTRLLFVVGSGRSGTSLLWNRLNRDPAVAVAPEIHFLDRWLPLAWTSGEPDLDELWRLFVASPHYHRLNLTTSAAEHARLASTPREMYLRLMTGHAEAQSAEIGGDKTPSNFRFVAKLLDWYPQARFVFIVRDPRSVVGSLNSLARDHHWARGATAKHVALWNAAAEAAVAWSDHPQVSVIRYEDLVTDEVNVLSELHSTLSGHPYDPSWLDGDARVERLPSGSLVSTTPTSTQRRESWRGRLRPGQADVVIRRCQPIAAHFGYHPDDESLALTEQIRYRIGAVRTSAQRVLRVLASPQGFLSRRRVRR